MQTANIRELMEKWARWRDSGNRLIGRELGYGECMSGRLLNGIRRIPCPAAGCVRGEVLVKINGQKLWMACSECLGSGYQSAKSTATKINPKLIRATGGKYPDELSPRIDRAVCALNRQSRRVILQEYCWSGTQEIKAARLRISHGNYRKILQRAVASIEQNLTFRHKRAKFG